jgi:hypothetical protein
VEGLGLNRRLKNTFIVKFLKKKNHEDELTRRCGFSSVKQDET